MTSGAFDAPPSDDRGGRPFGLGRRWAFAVAAVVALAAAVVVVLLLSSGGASSKPVAAGKSYGHLPSWLPKTAATAKPELEQASAGHPILAEEQGYTVHAMLSTGSADITAAGPAFPGYVTNYASRGLWPSGKPVPSTFYVTVTAVKGTIPVSAAAFSVENSAYQHVGATLSMKGGGKVPTTVTSGHAVTLVVHTKTLEGQGAIAWTPIGKKTLIAWIYQVELD
jgi:hypothetical protein